MNKEIWSLANVLVTVQNQEDAHAAKQICCSGGQVSHGFVYEVHTLDLNI